MKRCFCLAAAGVLLLATAGQAQTTDSLRQSLGSVPDFQLTDQSGQVVTQETLRGKVCVVSFFFCCCTTACPKTQEVMTQLQQQFAGSADVLLISINVFPSREDQETLKQYSKDRQADPQRWLLLRGSKKDIDDLVQNGFHQGLMPNSPPTPGMEMIHTPNLMVVDHRGVIRGYVNGLEPDEVERLKACVKRLIQAKYLPTINASLNGGSGVLLVLGFLFIKTRMVLVHKVCMLLALAVSAAFLGCYVYYHFAVLDGQPTQFSGEGAVRPVYYAILLSHIVLAVVVTPLALRVTYLGLRNRLARHVALARWTLPVWLYVSVTGVVVYWMLYHLYPPV
jgi:protein SCO1